MTLDQVTRSSVLLCLSAGLSLSGCTVRRAAPTVLRIGWPDLNETVVGMREVKCRAVADHIEIIGAGFHSREHETYVFFISEPYPVPTERWLHIAPADAADNADRYRLTMWLNHWEIPHSVRSDADRYFYAYQGLFVPRFCFSLSGRKMILDHVHLAPIGHAGAEISVSGQIVATKAREQDFQELRRRLHDRLTAEERDNSVPD